MKLAITLIVSTIILIFFSSKDVDKEFYIKKIEANNSYTEHFIRVEYPPIKKRLDSVCSVDTVLQKKPFLQRVFSDDYDTIILQE